MKSKWQWNNAPGEFIDVSREHRDRITEAINRARHEYDKKMLRMISDDKYLLGCGVVAQRNEEAARGGEQRNCAERE